MESTHTLPQKDETTKYCSKCETHKPSTLEFFFRDRRRGDGLSFYCKQCNMSYPRKSAMERRDYHRAYQQTEKHKTQRREYRKTKDGMAVRRAEYANYAAKQVGVGGSLTGQDILELFNKYPRCLRCGTVKDLTVDHVIPLDKNGPNAPDNLQVLCLKCNVSKHTKTIDYRPSYNPSTEVSHDAPR